MSNLINHLIGWLLYPVGDLVGQLIMSELSLTRFLVIMLAGGLIYRIEIPAWFRYIESVDLNSHKERLKGLMPLIASDSGDRTHLNWFGKTIGATLFFNPLWIARHMLLIELATVPFDQLDLASTLQSCLYLGTISFLTNLPLAFIGNYVVQRHLPLKLRFLGSALLTTGFNIKYAVEFRMFG